MDNAVYERVAEQRAVAPATTIAMMYDFDKTLTTKDQQEYTFIPRVDMSASEFWNKANKLAAENKMDGILAYMQCMLNEAKYRGVPINRGAFVEYGKDLEYYSGVREWFERINAYAAGVGVTIEHYIISSGLREIIEGCEIFGHFREVFACEFFYDTNNVAVWPKNVVNYTTKTQFLFRINKGVLDISDDRTLNKYVSENARPIPFRNMIYIGDGLTDVPCMKLVKVNGGYSFGVYTTSESARATAGSLLTDGRVNFIAPADYSDGSELDEMVKDVILKIAVEDKLARITTRQLGAGE